VSRTIKAIFFLLTLIFLIFLYQIVRFYSDENTVLRSVEPEAPTISNLGSGYYSFGEGGIYGVKNSSGKIIIEARWKSVERIGVDRFAVSRMESGGLRYGIIDNTGNIIVPFIYTEFERYNNEIIIARTENERFVLFDYCGNALVNEEWDKISKNYKTKSLAAGGNYIQLEKDKNLYRIAADENGRLVMSDIRLQKELFGEKCLVRIDNTSVAPGFDGIINLYGEIFDTSVEYIGAVFSGDSMKVKSLSFNGEYRELMLEGFSLRGGTLLKAETPVPVIKDLPGGAVDYRCSAAVTYSSPDEVLWDGNYTSSEHRMNLEIHLKKNQNGKLSVFKVYAVKADTY